LPRAIASLLDVHLPGVCIDMVASLMRTALAWLCSCVPPHTDATAPPPPEELFCGASPVQPAAVPLAEGAKEWPVWAGVSAAGPADWEGLGPLATRPTALALACADALMGDALSTSYVDAATTAAADAPGRAAASRPARAVGQARQSSAWQAHFYACDQYSLSAYLRLLCLFFFLLYLNFVLWP